MNTLKLKSKRWLRKTKVLIEITLRNLETNDKLSPRFKRTETPNGVEKVYVKYPNSTLYRQEKNSEVLTVMYG